MNNNALTHLLGIKYPVIQAPMAGVQNSALTIAVSKTGALGSLACGMLSPDKIVSEIKTIKSQTDNPYNLNFFCHTVPPYDENAHAKWQVTLGPYFEKYGLQCNSDPDGASRTPFNQQIADAIDPFKPKVISFHFGLPDKELLDRVKSWGTAVLSSATTVDEALWLQERGADAIIAQGAEAGGHRGMFLSQDITTQLGTAALVAQISQLVDIPVIAAGGIADRKGAKAAITLGAQGIQVGTAYLLCDEATTKPMHREALKSERTRHTALTTIFSGKPARGIVNLAMREIGYTPSNVPDFPYASIEMSQLRAAAEAEGSDDFTPLWCGQNATGCREIPAEALTRYFIDALAH